MLGIRPPVFQSGDSLGLRLEQINSDQSCVTVQTRWNQRRPGITCRGSLYWSALVWLGVSHLTRPLQLML